MKQLDDLCDKVTAVCGVEDSAITLLNGLSAQISVDANNINGLARALSDKSAQLAAAVAANASVQMFIETVSAA